MNATCVPFNSSTIAAPLTLQLSQTCYGYSVNSLKYEMCLSPFVIFFSYNNMLFCQDFLLLPHGFIYIPNTKQRREPISLLEVKLQQAVNENAKVKDKHIVS